MHKHPVSERKKSTDKVTPEVAVKLMILKYIYKFTSVWHRCWLICIQTIYLETMFTLFSVLFLLSFLVANLQTYFYINVLQLLVRFSSVIKQWKSQFNKIGTVKNTKGETQMFALRDFPFLKNPEFHLIWYLFREFGSELFNAAKK